MDPQALSALPRLGWAATPSPVTSLDRLAKQLGAAYLGVKRDDQLAELHGGTKIRKLDILLAAEPFKSAKRWGSLGAIGSGHLAILTAAAGALDRTLDAHVFWEPPSAGVLENLAFTASGSARLTYYPSRIAVGLTRPSLLLRPEVDGAAVIPPGATTPEGVVGCALGGLELARQIAAGEVPAPDRVYVALGSGGTAAGLALGLGLAGVKTTVHAVATVERIFTPRRKLAALVAAGARWLREHGVTDATADRAAPLVIDRTQVGPGYGLATAQSLAAVELGTAHAIGLEPIYTGKAFAALVADLAHGRGKGEKILFWHTARRGPLPAEDDWRERLPPKLVRRLDRATVTAGRRRLLAAGAAGIAALAVARLAGYEDTIGWTGTVLSAREARIVAAAAEALLPVRTGPAPLEIAANVDRYLVGMPPALELQIHGLLALVEHGTPLELHLARLTSLPVEARETFLATLRARGGLLAQAYRGLRDLLLVAHYQSPATWAELDYRGPWGPAAAPALMETPYEDFRAPEGKSPRGMIRP